MRKREGRSQHSVWTLADTQSLKDVTTQITVQPLGLLDPSCCPPAVSQSVTGEAGD